MSEKTFQTIDGQTLMSITLDTPRFIVPSLIPTGLHIIGGSPKVGKSWLMLWLCLNVAKGECLWNYQCRKGTTLYLCLEDSYDRIQSRLLDITDDAPNNLHFSIMAESIGSGLSEQIESFLQEHPDTVLIVIDTLQFIRSDAGSANPYANDYRELLVLKELANKHKIAILCVHHLRKMKDIDPMNMLSGTTGLSGVADTILVLDREKRTENAATLFCTGRDIESLELKLELDSETHIWKLIGQSEGEQIMLVDEVILTVAQHFNFSFSDFIGTATELSTEVEKTTGRTIPPATLSKKLMRFGTDLAELGWRCSFRRTRNEKIIEIRRQETVATNSEPYAEKA